MPNAEPLPLPPGPHPLGGEGLTPVLLPMNRHPRPAIGRVPSHGVGPLPPVHGPKASGSSPEAISS